VAQAWSVPVVVGCQWRHFIAQGRALNASRNVKVLVGRNTNAYIAMKSAPDLPHKNFTAMRVWTTTVRPAGRGQNH
jgi:hypothetical protein